MCIMINKQSLQQRFLHIIIYELLIGKVRESPPAKDRRPNHWATPPDALRRLAIL